MVADAQTEGRRCGDRPCGAAVLRAAVVLTVVATMLALWPAGALARARTVTLRVRVVGLPVGQAPVAVLTGPGVHERLIPAQLRLSHARPGRYVLTVAPVRVARGHGHVLAGATAYPTTRRTSVQVRPGQVTTLTGRYGTIINPGLRSVHARVLGVTGSPTHPRSLRLSGALAVAAGQVVSLPPSAALPGGVLARAQSVSRQRGVTVVVLGPVSVFDVVPVAQFNVPVHLGPAGAGNTHAAHAKFRSPTADCGPSIGSAGGVYRTLKNARFSGGWNTISVFGHHIPVGLTAGLDVDLTAGVQDRAGVSVGLSCEVDIPWQGMAGPVPVTGALYGNIHGSVDAGVGFDAELNVHVHAGARTIGVPPGAVFVPDVSFTNAATDVHAAGEVSVTAGFGAGIKFGLGSEWGADATINLDNDWDFTAQASGPDGSGCRTEAKFASFDAEAKLGSWTVQTPSTPPLFTKTLWGPTSCEPHPSGPSSPPAGGGPGAGGGSGGSGGGDPGATADDASCVSATFCLVSGGMAYQPGGVSWVYNGQGWSAPSGFGGGTYYGPVSCATPTFCVGISGGAPMRSGVFNGSSWGAPMTLNGTSGATPTVSCASTSFCLAVADASWLTFNGHSWSAPHPFADGVSHAILSCASPSFCVTGGNNSANQSVATVFDGSSWTAPQVMPGMSGPLTQVSCPTSSFCAAEGRGSTSPSTDIDVATFDGSAWHAGVRVTTSTGNGEGGSNLSCASATFCMLIANGLDAFRYNGSFWTAAQSIPNPEASSGAVPIGVPLACPTSSFCMATLQVSGYVVVYNGSSWSLTPPL